MTIHNQKGSLWVPTTTAPETRGPASSKLDTFGDWKTKDNTHKFYFTFKEQSLVVDQSGSSEVAFEKSAKECFDHFLGKAESEDEKLDLIDVCANPKKR